jgi:hypothetical protein
LSANFITLYRNPPQSYLLYIPTLYQLPYIISFFSIIFHSLLNCHPTTSPQCMLHGSAHLRIQATGSAHLHLVRPARFRLGELLRPRLCPRLLGLPCPAGVARTLGAAPCLACRRRAAVDGEGRWSPTSRGRWRRTPKPDGARVR